MSSPFLFSFLIVLESYLNRVVLSEVALKYEKNDKAGFSIEDQMDM